MLFNACKDIDLAINTGKTNYMETERQRSMITNGHIRIGIHSYEKVKIFKYISSLKTNQNSIQEGIKCRHKAGNVYYYSLQTAFLTSL